MGAQLYQGSGNGAGSSLDVYDVVNYPIWQEVLRQLFANGTNTFACRQQIDNPLCIAWICPQTSFLQRVIWRHHIF